MQSMWKHRGAVRERGSSGHFGRVGLLTLMLFQVLLPVLAPLVDVFFIYGLIFLDPLTTAAVWLAVLALQMLGAAYAFHLEREPLRALWLMPLQQIVYRQLMYAVLIQSVATAVAGVRLRWQKLNRSGAANNDLAAAMRPHGGGSADRRAPKPPAASQAPQRADQVGQASREVSSARRVPPSAPPGPPGPRSSNGSADPAAVRGRPIGWQNDRRNQLRPGRPVSRSAPGHRGAAGPPHDDPRPAQPEPPRH